MIFIDDRGVIIQCLLIRDLLFAHHVSCDYLPKINRDVKLLPGMMIVVIHIELFLRVCYDTHALVDYVVGDPTTHCLAFLLFRVCIHLGNLDYSFFDMTSNRVVVTVRPKTRPVR